MQTIEQLKAQHAAELEIALKKQALADQLPAMPAMLTDTKGLGYWATYKTKTTAEVAALVRLFAPYIVPTVQVRDGCLYRQPLGLLPARLGNKEGTEVIFSLDTDQGRGFGVCVKFYFYTLMPSGDYVKVICELPNNHRATAQLTPPEYDRNGYPRTQGDARPNNALRGLFHDHIAWSANLRGQDARYTYTLCDDAPEYRETLQLLESTELATWWKAEATA